MKALLFNVCLFATSDPSCQAEKLTEHTSRATCIHSAERRQEEISQKIIWSQTTYISSHTTGHALLRANKEVSCRFVCCSSLTHQNVQNKYDKVSCTPCDRWSCSNFHLYYKCFCIEYLLIKSHPIKIFRKNIFQTNSCHSVEGELC